MILNPIAADVADCLSRAMAEPNALTRMCLLDEVLRLHHHAVAATDVGGASAPGCEDPRPDERAPTEAR